MYKFPLSPMGQNRPSSDPAEFPSDPPPPNDPTLRAAYERDLAYLRSGQLPTEFKQAEHIRLWRKYGLLTPELSRDAGIAQALNSGQPVHNIQRAIGHARRAFEAHLAGNAADEYLENAKRNLVMLHLPEEGLQAELNRLDRKHASGAFPPRPRPKQKEQVRGVDYVFPEDLPKMTIEDIATSLEQSNQRRNSISDSSVGHRSPVIEENRYGDSRPRLDSPGPSNGESG